MRTRRPRRRANPRKLVLVSLGSILLTLLAAEVALQWLQIPSEHSGFAFLGQEFEDGRNFQKDIDLF